MSLSTNDKEDYLAHRMQNLPSQTGNVFGKESIQGRSRIRISQSTRDSNSQSTLLSQDQNPENYSFDDSNSLNQQELHDSNSLDQSGLPIIPPTYDSNSLNQSGLPVVPLTLTQRYELTMAKRLVAERQLVLSKALEALQNLPKNCTAA
jgi:hypothetical protein